jgi:putative component of membrane protein insertase Oxa1/YidC/SpoIIIJ protein YidD
LQTTNLQIYIQFPQKKSSPVYRVKTISSFHVLLSYIDSRQCLYFLSCSPTLIADNIFSYGVLALLH